MWFRWFLSNVFGRWAVRWRRFQPMLNHLLLTWTWMRLFSFWSISVPFVGVITNRYNSKLTRPMLAGSSVPMPDELMELYNLYQQELHTRRAKDRIVEMKHIRKYCAQYLILKKSFVLLLPILLQTLPLFEEILLPGKMRKRQTSYQSWTRC